MYNRREGRGPNEIFDFWGRWDRGLDPARNSSAAAVAAAAVVAVAATGSSWIAVTVALPGEGAPAGTVQAIFGGLTSRGTPMGEATTNDGEGTIVLASATGAATNDASMDAVGPGGALGHNGNLWGAPLALTLRWPTQSRHPIGPNKRRNALACLGRNCHNWDGMKPS